MQGVRVWGFYFGDPIYFFESWTLKPRSNYDGPCIRFVVSLPGSSENRRGSSLISGVKP